MKTLTTYIQLSQFENYLLEKLMTFCSIGILWEHAQGLDPHYQFHHSSIYESYGKFENSGKVIYHIIDSLKKNFNDQTIDCSKDNVFFKKVNVKIIKIKGCTASYLDFKNNTVFIEIVCEDLFNLKLNADDYGLLLLHKLLHCYDDYNRIKTGKPSIFDIQDKDYMNAYNSVGKKNNDIRMKLGTCKYFLNPQERNAYFTQLEADVKKLLQTNNYVFDDTFNYEKFKEDFKNISIWKTYFSIAAFIEELKNYNDEEKKLVEATYAKFFSENKSFSDIKNGIIKQWRKFESKLHQLVPIFICQNLPTKSKKSTYVSPETLTKLKESKDLLYIGQF